MDAKGSSVFVAFPNGGVEFGSPLDSSKGKKADLVGVNLDVKDPFWPAPCWTFPRRPPSATASSSADTYWVNRQHQCPAQGSGGASRFCQPAVADIPRSWSRPPSSQSGEEHRLNDDRYQDKLAEAIVRGIRLYFSKHPPPAEGTDGNPRVNPFAHVKRARFRPSERFGCRGAAFHQFFVKGHLIAAIALAVQRFVGPYR